MFSGIKLYEIRRSRSVTQKELGEAAGVSEAAISQFENGLKTPKIDVAYRIAEFLGVKVDDFKTKRGE